MSIHTSVSGDPVHRDDVFRMASFVETQLKQYGVETQTVDLGTHVMEGETLKLPPLVLGRIGNDKSKKTILIYGHFDVQPVCRLLHRPLCKHILYFSLGTNVGWLGLSAVPTDQR